APALGHLRTEELLLQRRQRHQHARRSNTELRRQRELGPAAHRARGAAAAPDHPQPVRREAAAGAPHQTDSRIRNPLRRAQIRNSMATKLLIYENAAPVSKTRHAGMSVEVGNDYGFARNVNAVPLMAVEFPSA